MDPVFAPAGVLLAAAVLEIAQHRGHQARSSALPIHDEIEFPVSVYIEDMDPRDDRICRPGTAVGRSKGSITVSLQGVNV